VLLPLVDVFVERAAFNQESSPPAASTEPVCRGSL
jgi:hypothetical protein